MPKVPVRDLRNDTAGVIDRVAAGESLTLTVRGRSVASIVPLRLDRRWLSRAEFVRTILGLRPDDTLADDVHAVAADLLDPLE